MNKLRLNLGDLQVSSFVADASAPGKGTVHGHTGGQETCRVNYTCALSCTDCGTYYCATGDSCDGTCIDSCAWTACDNCRESENEVGTCIPPC